MHHNEVVADRVHGVTRLTVNRPDVGNALDLATARQLRDAIRTSVLERDAVLVITGAGRLFCAGGDVSAFASAADPAAYLAELADTLHEGLVELQASPIVTIAAVNGPAAGAGLGLVLNADLVISAPQARYVAAYGALGLTPDAGVSYLLPRIVGLRRASEMVLGSRSLTADEALGWGLVNRIESADQLLETAHSLATEIANGAAGVAGATKALLRSDAASYAEHLAAESASISEMSALADSRARVAAFVNQNARRSSGR